MKKFIAMVVCFTLTACVLTGCGRNSDHKTTDTTTTPSTMPTQAQTSTTSTSASIPMTSEVTIPETPDTSSTPMDDNNDMGGNNENGRSRSRTHYPSVVGENR